MKSDFAEIKHEIKWQKTCSYCFKEFGAWNRNQKYCCPECKHDAKIKNMAIYRDRQDRIARRKEEAQKKQRAVIDIAAEAKKAGMSYGKYVALHNL